MQHAILAVSGVPCSNIQCLYNWQEEGWIAVWEVDQIEANGNGWLLGVVTAGEVDSCPTCGAKQRLPKVFDRAGAIAEVHSFRSSEMLKPAGYFCRMDCSKGKIVAFKDG